MSRPPEIHRVSRVQFNELREEWNAFLSRSNHNCLFQTWEWLSAWWEAFGASHREFWFLVARDHEGDLCGLFPFFRVTGQFGGLVPVHVLQATGRGLEGYEGGSEYSTYLMPPLMPGREDVVLASLTGYLHAQHRNWDMVFLGDLLSAHPTTSAIHAAAERRFLTRRYPQEIYCVLQLPPTYEDYLRQLSAGKRATLQRKARGISQRWRVEILTLQTANALDAFLRDYYLLVGRRHAWTPSPEKEAFLRRLCETFLGTGWLRFDVLKLDGRPAATMLGFAYGDRYYYYKSAVDPDPAFSSVSPGAFLRNHAIRRAIDEGLTHFDYLGGEYGYKREWSNLEQQLEVIALYGWRPGTMSKVAVNKAFGLLRRGLERFRAAA